MKSISKFSSSEKLENLTNIQGGAVSPTVDASGQADAEKVTEEGIDCPTTTCHDGFYKMADIKL